MAADVVNAGDKILAIAHCNCEERAKEVQRLLKRTVCSEVQFYRRYIRDQYGLCQ